MKIAVIPDMAMMVINLVNKMGHECLCACNITQDDLENHEITNDDECFIDYSKPPFNMKGYNMNEYMKYTSFDEPSGVKGRVILYDNIIQNSDAAIIINENPVSENNKIKMYDTLNELILFSCISCHNAYDVLVYEIRHKKIPRLELTKPSNRDELIKFIENIIEFLKNVEQLPEGSVVDKRIKPYGISLDEVSEIFKSDETLEKEDRR